MGIAEARKRLADLVHAAAVHGTVTYLTSRGRRVAVIAPLPDRTQAQ